MVDFVRAFPSSGDVRLVLQVHDSLVCECPGAAAGDVEQALGRIMEETVSLSVPLKVESKRGKISPRYRAPTFSSVVQYAIGVGNQKGRCPLLMRTLRSQVRWIMIAIVVLFVLSIFGMYGFSSPRGNSSGGEDYAVAEIDGKTVMRSVLEQQLRNYVERANVRDITSADIPGLYQAALENIALASLEKDRRVRHVSFG